jgi:hypothetical protein
MELEKQLRTAGWQEGIPDAWQFLTIDAPATAEATKATRFVPRELQDGDHYVPLTSSGEEYSAYSKTIEYRSELAGGWLPGSSTYKQEVWFGSGQRRAVGRVLTLHAISEIKERIEKLLSAMSTTDADMQINSLNAVIGDTDGDARLVDVWLVTSLAGGTGSGTFLDVSAALQAIAAQRPRDDKFKMLNVHRAIAYAPDVFYTVPEDARIGVVPNTLASVSELLNISLSDGTPSEGERIALELMGSPIEVRRPMAPGYTFVQGRSNGSMDFETPDEVYRSTARLLSMHILNKNVRSQFQRYLINNAGRMSTVKELVDLQMQKPNERVDFPVSAMGISTVSLGRSLFADFAARRLAKLIVQQFEESDDKVAQLRKQKQFEPQFRKFLERLGLTESQIMESVRANTQTAIQKIQTEGAAWGAKNREETPKGLRDKFDALVGDLSKEQKEAQANARNEWVKTQSSRIIRESLNSIAEDGVGITLEFLRQTQQELEQIAQRTQQASTSGSSLGSRASKVRAVGSSPGALGKLFGKKAPSKSAQATDGRTYLNELISEFTASFSSTISQFENSLNASMLLGFAEGVVAPLRAAIEDARASLVGLLEVDRESRLMVDSWPDFEATGSLLPAKDEILLEDSVGPQGFNAELFRLIGKSLGKADEKDKDVIPRALGEILAGLMPNGTPTWPTLGGAGAEPASLELTGSYDPKFTGNSDELHGASPGIKPATFSFSLSAESILKWSDSWMRSRVGIESYVNQTLASYLHGSDAEKLLRRRNFVNAIRTAVQRARPMATLNDGALEVIHPGLKLKGYTVISDIPLGEEHGDQRKEIIDIVGKDFKCTFDPSSPATDIQVVRYLGNFVHPAVLDSIMKPMVSEWQDATGEGSTGVSKFWNQRRSRTLSDFVPVPRLLLVDMAKGWTVARILGIIDDQAVRDFLVHEGGLISTPPVAAPTSIAGGYFPKKLLTTVDPTRAIDLFPALMESMMLSFVELSTGDAGILNAYRWLIHAGQNAPSLISAYLLDHPDQRKVLIERINVKVGTQAMEEPDADAVASDLTQFTLAWECRKILSAACSALLEIPTLREGDQGSPQSSSGLNVEGG